MPSTAPLVRHFQFTAPAVGTAGNDDTAPAFVAPFDCTVTAVEFIGKTTLTGAATNYRSHSLVNKGQAGSGTTVVATLAYDSTGVVATALVPKSLTLSATAANLVLEEGDVLQWKSDHTASGATDPGGQVRVTVTRN